MATDDFFRARLDQMIDLRHPLAVLAGRMPWSDIEAALAPAFVRRDRKGRPVEGADMFGPTLAVAGAGASNAGRPRLPIRLMVALLYLKHAYNASDESVVVRWSQDVYFQFFSGQVYFEPRLPCDPAQISRFRRVLGEADVEQLLKTTIEAAVTMGAVKKQGRLRNSGCRGAVGRAQKAARTACCPGHWPSSPRPRAGGSTAGRVGGVRAGRVGAVAWSAQR